MTEEMVKEGVALAEQETREKQVGEVKKIVVKTLEKLREQEKKRDEAQKQVEILQMDLDDLKEGKLDRIVERQEKDEKAKQISVVIIIKEEHHHYHGNPWYYPYRIIWNPMPVYPLHPVFGDTTVPLMGSQFQNKVVDVENAVYTTTSTGVNTATLGMITCSAAKDATVGTYQLSNQEVVHLR